MDNRLSPSGPTKAFSKVNTTTDQKKLSFTVATFLAICFFLCSGTFTITTIYWNFQLMQVTHQEDTAEINQRADKRYDRHEREIQELKDELNKLKEDEKE